MRRLTALLALVGLTLMSTASVSQAAGEPPQPREDRYDLFSGKKLQVSAPAGVLANDIDPEGDPLTAILGEPPRQGTVRLSSDGSFRYTPDFVAGTDWFTYRAFDGTTLSYPVFVVITVDPGPVAAADSFRFLLPGPATIPDPGVLANDTSVAGNYLYAELGRKTVHGTLQLRLEGGGFVYRPGPHFRGRDSFTYRAFDGVRRSKLVRVDLVGVKTNALPVGRPDAYTVQEDSFLDVPAPGVLSNDTDADGDPLQAELLSEPGPYENFEFRPDGSFLFQPFPSWDSDLTFRYRVSDGIGYSAPILVTIDMIAVNNPPFGEDDFYEFDRTQGNLEVPAPGVLANDGDHVEFDAVHVWDKVGGPGYGQLTLASNGAFTYVPDPGFVGTDGFSYRPGDSSPGNVTFVTIVVTDGGP